MTLDGIAALEALLAGRAEKSPRPWENDSRFSEVRDARGDWVADCVTADANLITAAVNALPGLLALARRTLEHERPTGRVQEMRAASAQMRYGTAADTDSVDGVAPVPVETTADDMRHAAAIVCRTLADEPPAWIANRSDWAEACTACAERIASVDVCVSRLVLSDGEGAT